MSFAKKKLYCWSKQKNWYTYVTKIFCEHKQTEIYFCWIQMHPNSFFGEHNIQGKKTLVNTQTECLLAFNWFQKPIMFILWERNGGDMLFCFASLRERACVEMTFLRETSNSSGIISQQTFKLLEQENWNTYLHGSQYMWWPQFHSPSASHSGRSAC